MEHHDVMGVIGEYAMCRMLLLPVEIWNTDIRKAEDEVRFDCMMRDGRTIDVKTQREQSCLAAFDNSDKCWHSL